MLQGLGVSPGTAVGPAYVIAESRSTNRVAGSPLHEQRAYERASRDSLEQIASLAARLRADGLEEQAGIMDAQALMLQDPGWVELITQGIAAGAPATTAVHTAGETFAEMFEGMEDAYLAARAADVRDVASRLQRAITGEEELPHLQEPSIVVARELTPSQTVSLDRNLVRGLVTETGSATAHTAILARALNIPAVVGVPNLAALVQPRQRIALDGETGEVLVNPTEEHQAHYRGRAATLQERRVALRALRHLPAQTRDGYQLVLAANIGSPEEVDAAVDVAAEGIGLFRTEFLFADRTTMPTEEEQVIAYQSVLQAMPEHRVVIRTLDVGGDKPLSYLPAIVEANPFLGQRGLRYTESHPKILRTQLRALLRAAPAGRLSIMLPMVSELRQIKDTASLVDEVASEVGGQAELGIMVEVPAAALLASLFAPHVSFFSVGSNDLTQYTLAIDRLNEHVASLYHPLHPAILRLLDHTIRGAHQHDRWAGICGELAGDLSAIPLLIGLGFDELSMTPSRIPEARERIRALDAGQCRDLAARTLQCATEEDVQALVRELPER